MTACAWCLRYCGWRDEGCQFPHSELCRTEREAERLAHAINDQRKSVIQRVLEQHADVPSPNIT